MKRSEMVDNIIQYLGELDVKYPNGYGYEEQAEYLLDRIEKDRMLPPSDYEEVLRDPYANGYIVYRKFENVIIDRPNYKITDFWEPEDD